MKKIALGFSILAVTSAFVVSCKPDKDTPPVADTETQSAVYASWMNYAVSDIEMCVSFMGENVYDRNYQGSRPFYSAYPASGTTVSVTRDTITNSNQEDQIVMSWNKTRCIDGNYRDGSIFLFVPQVNNQRYTRDPKWQGRIKFVNFKVNNWTIELFNPDAPVYLYNITPVGYNLSTTKLTWRFAGKLRFKHPTDNKKDMVWDGELFKTLDNTDDPKVFPTSKQGGINWLISKISYYGKFNGSGPQIKLENDTVEAEITPNVDYAMVINPETPIKRDFQCTPDLISGVVINAPTNTVSLTRDEHHPFRQGIASFSVGTSYPRQIYYGNEGEPQLEPQCDNTGEVMIKGTAYRVNFWK